MKFRNPILNFERTDGRTDMPKAIFQSWGHIILSQIRFSIKWLNGSMQYQSAARKPFHVLGNT